MENKERRPSRESLAIISGVNRQSNNRLSYLNQTLLNFNPDANSTILNQPCLDNDENMKKDKKRGRSRVSFCPNPMVKIVETTGSLEDKMDIESYSKSRLEATTKPVMTDKTNLSVMSMSSDVVPELSTCTFTQDSMDISSFSEKTIESNQFLEMMRKNSDAGSCLLSPNKTKYTRMSMELTRTSEEKLEKTSILEIKKSNHFLKEIDRMEKTVGTQKMIYEAMICRLFVNVLIKSAITKGDLELIESYKIDKRFISSFLKVKLLENPFLILESIECDEPYIFCMKLLNSTIGLFIKLDKSPADEENLQSWNFSKLLKCSRHFCDFVGGKKIEKIKLWHSNPDLIKDTREKSNFMAIVKKCYSIAENPPIKQAYDLPKMIIELSTVVEQGKRFK
ncbi:DgyrCDS13176 [Dimorphilus gyrociliatus]|uniref:DgyrCDS13176 n=1 Tax=Dimorphilus gyrociliatus TaxID=2664684 RepID=A0A7I8W9W2_9ANNE|nr:DgyrCDS13176 [Dimorphilus gyrociliatus]